MRDGGRGGGIHHGVDAGKNTIDSDRVFTVYLTPALVFPVNSSTAFVHLGLFVRGGRDIGVKSGGVCPERFGFSACSLLAIQLAHHHQQHQVEAGRGTNFLEID